MVPAPARGLGLDGFQEVCLLNRIQSLFVHRKGAGSAKLEDGAFISQIVKIIQKLKLYACMLMCDNCFMILVGNPRPFWQL